jgi:hypothetical protein
MNDVHEKDVQFKSQFKRLRKQEERTPSRVNSPRGMGVNYLTACFPNVLATSVSIRRNGHGAGTQIMKDIPKLCSYAGVT